MGKSLVTCFLTHGVELQRVEPCLNQAVEPFIALAPMSACFKTFCMRIRSVTDNWQWPMCRPYRLSYMV